MTTKGFTVDMHTVYERAMDAALEASEFDALDFYTPAIALGASPAEAERIDIILTTRVMRSRGAI